MKRLDIMIRKFKIPHDEIYGKYRSHYYPSHDCGLKKDYFDPDEDE